MKLQFTTKTDSQIRSTARFRDNFALMIYPEFPFIKAILVNTFAMSILGLGIPLTIQTVINTITSSAMMQPLVMLCLILVFVLSFSSLLQVIQTYTVEILKRRLFVRFGLLIAEKLNHYKDENFRKSNSPSLINRYFDILIMQSSMVTFFVDGFGFLIMFSIGFGLLIFYHPYFLIFAIAMALFLVLNWMLFGPDGVKAGSPEADGRYDTVSWIEELSRNRNIFSSEKGREFSNKKILFFFNQWLDKRNTLFNFQYRQHIGLQIYNVLTNVFLFFLGGFLVLKGQLSLGQLVAASLVVSNITASLPRLQNFFFSVYDFSTSVNIMAQFYDYPLEDEDGKNIKVTTENIEFKEIAIQPNYNFNFKHPAKNKFFILVKSFSSIDVMYDLIMGFITPTKGVITFDNKHKEDINVANLRDQIQLVRHDQYFAGSILENLTGFSQNPFEMSLVHDAVDRVGLLENILSFPDKFETLIRPNGYPLSKSQLLSLQVAKAILMKPALLYVTPDFEQISSFKRKKVLKELVSPKNSWTLMFFSQKNYGSIFNVFYSLGRDGLRPISDEKQLREEMIEHV